MNMSGLPDYLTPVLGPGHVSAVIERRSTIFNDSDLVDGAMPPSSYTEETYQGKFYPRGCRGMLEQLQIYCKRTGAGDIELRYSPQPGLGLIGTVTVTPGSSWAWKSATIEKIWNYDSLFIWVYTCDADVSWAYDAGVPVDGHSSDDSGATWEDEATRPFIRARFTGETAGDVPISGIVNNIPIPTASSLVVAAAKIVPPDETIQLLVVEGAGYCDFIEFRLLARADSHLTNLSVWCDGVRVFQKNFQALRYGGYHPGSSPVSVMRYALNGVCWMTITKRWEFRRELRLTAYNMNVQQEVSAGVYPNLMR